MRPFLNVSLLVLWTAAGCGGAADAGTAASTSDDATSGAPAPDASLLRLTPSSAARHGVETHTVTARLLQRELRVPAHVAFDENHTAHIGCPLRGRVAEVPVSLGSTVEAGDALLVVDSPELGEAQIDLLQRRTALESARSRVGYAEAAWQRATALYEESRGIAQAEVLRREAEHAAARAAVREAEVALLAAEQRLHLLGMTKAEITAVVDGSLEGSDIAPRLTIRAPFAATVIHRDVVLGELVSPDRDMLLSISNLQRLWILADVPEARLDAVLPGATVRVHRGRDGDAVAEGTVERIAPVVDRATRTAEVRVVVEGSETLRAGMFVEARIEAPAEGGRPVLAVPVEAVQTVDRREVVFVPTGEPDTFRMRPVEVGDPIRGYRAVRHGLAEGEQVVTTGSFVLKALALGTAGASEE